MTILAASEATQSSAESGLTFAQAGAMWLDYLLSYRNCSAQSVEGYRTARCPKTHPCLKTPLKRSYGRSTYAHCPMRFLEPTAESTARNRDSLLFVRNRTQLRASSRQAPAQ